MARSIAHRWTLHDPGDYPDTIPEEPGCYVIYMDGRVVYVGSTTNVLKRIKAHGIRLARYSNGYYSAWGRAHRLLVKCKVGERYGEWRMWEARLIKRLQPPYNRRGVRPENREEFKAAP